MKTKNHFVLLLILLATCCVLNSVEAQVPQAIPYQAVARDNSGNVIANQIISLRFSIHDTTGGGTVVCKEPFLFTFCNPTGKIGTGTQCEK